MKVNYRHLLSMHLDDAQSIIFERELEHRLSRAIEIMKSPPEAYRLIPGNTEAGPAAKTITYEQYDRTGMAKIIANYATDWPRVDVTGQEFTSRIRAVGDSIYYSFQDIRDAAMANKPLEQRKADSAVEAIRTKVNLIGWYGDEEFNLPGFLTNPNIPSGSVLNDGTGASTLWSTKTPDQILRDLNDQVYDMIDLTRGVEKPDTLLLTHTRRGYLATTPRSATSDTTILDYFLATNGYIKTVEAVPEISAADRTEHMGADDPFSGEISVVYRKDPGVVEFHNPIIYEQLPPFWDGAGFEIKFHARTGGATVYRPLAMSIREGI